MKKLRYILQDRYLFKVLAIVVLIMCLIYTKSIEKKSIYHNETSFIGIVYNLEIDNSKNIFFLKSKENIIIYDYDSIAKNINLGDQILVEGTLNEPTNNTIPNLFNYKKYLENKEIYKIVIAKKIVKLKNNTSLIYYLRSKILKRITKISNASEYIRLFILGDKAKINDDIIKSYQTNGISHLFSISGMHISFFTFLIFKILKKISYNNYYNYSVVIVILICYITIIGNIPSAIRSLIMYILSSINKLFNFKIKTIDIILLVLILMLLINPYYLYDMSFQYSYVITFSIIIYQNKLKKIKKFKKIIHISIISFLFSFPICIFYFYQISILSIFLNIILIPTVTIIIFPLSVIIFFIPKLSILLSLIITPINKLTLFLYTNQIGIITFPKPNIVYIIIYYILLIISISHKKYYLIILLIIYPKVLTIITPYPTITFLDVKQGDSIFISLQHQKSNILIDTGGIPDGSYSLVDNSIIPYLKSINVSKLDYLIITHGDFDHMGESINLINNFKVEKVIFNCGPYNDLEQELIRVLDKKKIKYYSCIKELNIDKNKLYFLQTKEYDNENDNSNVIYTELNGYKFMFMGDAGVTTEKEIMNKYNLPDIYVLKVGHHGSKTSSSKEFINEINPKYSIISVGKYNRYGHPNKEALNNLENSKIYRTDQDGSIMFKIKNNKLKIETCTP